MGIVEQESKPRMHVTKNGECIEFIPVNKDKTSFIVFDGREKLITFNLSRVDCQELHERLTEILDKDA